MRRAWKGSSMLTRSLALVSVIALVPAAAVIAAPSRMTVRPWSRVITPAFKKCAAWPGGTGLVVDGDFHQVADPGSHYSEYYTGDHFAPGWRVGRGSIDFSGSTGWGPAVPNNACTIDLDGINPGSINARAFTTTPSSAYTVTFLMSGNGYCGQHVLTMEVEAAGQSQQFTWNTASGNDAEHGVYSMETWGFSATSTSTKLEFRSLDSRKSGCGVIVGAISVTAT